MCQGDTIAKEIRAARVLRRKLALSSCTKQDSQEFVARPQTVGGRVTPTPSPSSKETMMDVLSPTGRALAMAAVLAIAALATGPSHADDRDHGRGDRDRHDHHWRDRDRRDGYYGPPPPVVYAPDQGYYRAPALVVGIPGLSIAIPR
jgi:hypothetical protein